MKAVLVFPVLQSEVAIAVKSLLLAVPFWSQLKEILNVVRKSLATEMKLPVMWFLWEERNLCVHMYLFSAVSARKAGKRCYSLPTWKHLSIFRA